MKEKAPELGDAIFKGTDKWRLQSFFVTPKTGKVFKAMPFQKDGKWLEVSEDDIGEGKTYGLLKFVA